MHLREFLKRTPLYTSSLYLIYRSWKYKTGNDPHYFVKRKVLKKYALKYRTRLFVETGTYYGDMVFAMRNHFDHLYSIELDNCLWSNANKRFAYNKKIEIIHGDSSQVLPQLLSKISDPCFFWLDGHYSGGSTAKGVLNTPVLQELGAILSHKVRNHVILIDDARCFNGQNNYPTLEELRGTIKVSSSDYTFEVADDIVRICPKKTSNDV